MTRSITFKLAMAAATTAVCVLAGYGLVHAADSDPSTEGFTLTAQISGLYPGITRQAQVSVTNPYSDPLTLTSVSATATGASTSCPLTSLTLGTWTGSQTVPGNGSADVTIPATLAAASDNTCAATTFTLSLTGSGQRADESSSSPTASPPPPSPSLSPSPSPSVSPAPSASPSPSPSISPSRSASPSPSASPKPAAVKVTEASSHGVVTLTITTSPSLAGKTVYFYVKSGLTGKISPMGTATIAPDGTAARVLHLHPGQHIEMYAHVSGDGTNGYSNYVTFVVH